MCSYFRKNYELAQMETNAEKPSRFQVKKDNRLGHRLNLSIRGLLLFILHFFIDLFQINNFKYNELQ